MEWISLITFIRKRFSLVSSLARTLSSRLDRAVSRIKSMSRVIALVYIAFLFLLLSSSLHPFHWISMTCSPLTAASRAAAASATRFISGRLVGSPSQHAQISSA